MPLPGGGGIKGGGASWSWRLGTGPREKVSALSITKDLSSFEAGGLVCTGGGVVGVGLGGGGDCPT